MIQDITIRLGESGPDFARRYPSITKVQHQPAGIDFYSIDWDKNALGTVRFEHGQRSFVIESAFGVLADQKLGSPQGEGIAEWSVNAGITAPDLISHDEARLKIHAMLQRILDAGWKNTIEIGAPRLQGRERMNYAISTNNYIGLDARYVPPLDEWMRIESRTPWTFYADGVYITVTFMRDPSLADPRKPGAYLLSYAIRTQTEYFRSLVAPENRPRWKDFVAGELAQAKEERAGKETELKAKGVPIDESYQDPPVPSFK